MQSSLSGEAWQRGLVVLAWSQTEYAGVIDGQNLVIHEFAHKLDMLNGAANGFFPATQEFEHIGIDCYAASSPVEFFAALSEVFLGRPDVVKKPYPEIYEQFCQYYRQEPLQRLD